MCCVPDNTIIALARNGRLTQHRIESQKFHDRLTMCDDYIQLKNVSQLEALVSAELVHSIVPYLVGLKGKDIISSAHHKNVQGRRKLSYEFVPDDTIRELFSWLVSKENPNLDETICSVFKWVEWCSRKSINKRSRTRLRMLLELSQPVITNKHLKRAGNNLIDSLNSLSLRIADIRRVTSDTRYLPSSVYTMNELLKFLFALSANPNVEYKLLTGKKWESNARYLYRAMKIKYRHKKKYIVARPSSESLSGFTALYDIYPPTVKEIVSIAKVGDGMAQVPRMLKHCKLTNAQVAKICYAYEHSGRDPRPVIVKHIDYCALAEVGAWKTLITYIRTTPDLEASRPKRKSRAIRLKRSIKSSAKRSELKPKEYRRLLSKVELIASALGADSESTDYDSSGENTDNDSSSDYS